MDDFKFLTSKNLKIKIISTKGYLNKIFIRNKKSKKIAPSKDKNKIEIKDIYNNPKTQISTKQIIIKKRNAGVDLLRILSMLGKVYTHILYDGKGISKYNRFKSEIINSYTYVFWHNNAFALISGVVGYKSSKYCNLLYLWLCVVFYSVGIRYFFIKYKKVTSLNGELFQEYCPAISGRYWYFSSYFGMFIFLPVVNKGIQDLNKPEFELVVISIFGIFAFWYNYINSKSDFFSMKSGNSTIWLLCLYIMGSYIGKFHIGYIGIKRYIFNLILFFIFLFFCYIHNKYSDYIISDSCGAYKIKLINFLKKLMSNNLNSVIRTTQAILITLLFFRLKCNEYLSKIISFFGHLTFGVYLIHINRNTSKHYLNTFLIGESDNLTLREVMQMLILKSMKFFFECIIIEYLRQLLFNILRIRKICISIEKIAFKIVSYKK